MDDNQLKGLSKEWWREYNGLFTCCYIEKDGRSMKEQAAEIPIPLRLSCVIDEDQEAEEN